MDDMTAFENRLAEDARRAAGPPRPVDAVAVFAAIPVDRSPWGRFQSMFGAAKVAFAGVIVALFAGFVVLSLVGERPDSVVPAAATSTPSEAPSPTAVRVDVPEAGFRITVPAGWTYELPYETDRDPAVALSMDSPPGPEVPFTQSCHILAPNPDETRTLDELVVEDLAPVPDELVALYGQVVAERTDLTLPAGLTVRVDRTFDDAGTSIYYFTDGQRVRRLECAAERLVDDHWRSVAQTFEFMPQTDDAAEPADSSSFMTTAELLAKLVTEEVEPGVLRVLDDHIDDGRGIERPAEGFPSMFVDVRPDGEVWLSGGGGQGDLFQLGAVGSYEDAASGAADSPGPLEVGPDGTFWAHDDGIVRRFIDGVWTSWRLEDGLVTRAITTDRDGSPWVLASPDSTGSERLLTLLPNGSWQQIEVPFALSGSPDWRHIDSTPDGSIWLSGGQVRAQDGAWTVAMVRFDDVEWELVDAPGAAGHTHGLGIGPDGELWREFVDPEARLDLDPDPEREDLSGDWIGLARLDEGDWTTFGAADGVGSWGHRVGVFFGTDLLEVGPDGTVWVNAARHAFDCGGVASFDGVEWKPYLEGRCVHDLAVAPDGGVWVRADLDSFEGNVGTFVIIPDG